MKIYVDELPKHPQDCLFAKSYPYDTEDENGKIEHIPNCLFRCKNSSVFEDLFSPIPNKVNCILATGKSCPFLIKGDKYNYDVF